MKLKDVELNYFDSGDFRIKIEEAIKSLTYEKNKDVRCLAILRYFYDNVPGFYSITFKFESGDSVYYVDELKKVD